MFYKLINIINYHQLSPTHFSNLRFSKGKKTETIKSLMIFLHKGCTFHIYYRIEAILHVQNFTTFYTHTNLFNYITKWIGLNVIKIHEFNKITQIEGIEFMILYPYLD